MDALDPQSQDTSTTQNAGYSSVAAWGHYVPEQIVSSSEIESRFGLEAGWIFDRTGVRQRRIANPEQAVSDLAILAGKNALQNWTANRHAQAADIRTLILATSTPDHLLPPTGPFVASQLGLGNAAAMDLAVACSGFVYALKLADAMVRSDCQPVMVIAANILSRRCKPGDVGTNAIFADAAGAAILRPSFEKDIIDIELASDGSGWNHLMIPDGGSRRPIGRHSFESESHLMEINNGMAVFRYAVEAMTEMGQQILAKNQFSAETIDAWVPHQANVRIINSVQKNLGIDPSKSYFSIEQYGNSSAATIPVTISDAIQNGRLKHGEVCLMTAAAAGLTSGAALIRI